MNHFFWRLRQYRRRRYGRKLEAFEKEMLGIRSFDELKQFLNKHEEKAFVAQALIVALVMSQVGLRAGPFLIYLFCLGCIFFIPLSGSFLLGASMMNSGSLLKFLRRYITINPFVRTGKRRPLDSYPWATFGLIVVNIFLFLLWNPWFGLGHDWQVNGKPILIHLCFPAPEPYMWLAPLTFITSIFSHGSGAHLFWNMFFLGAFGIELERRLGWKRFLGLYMGLGLIGNIPGFLGYLDPVRLQIGLGASGAISGLMGLYMVRCYFRPITWPVPLGPLPFFLRLKLNATTICGIFFVKDMSGLIRGGTNIGHSEHLAGMIAGIYLAYRLGLHHEARQERHSELAMDGFNAVSGWGGNEVEMRKVLKANPEHTEALLALARYKTKLLGMHFERDEEGAQLYEKLVVVLLASNPQQAADVFVEYHKKFQQGMAPAITFRVASILYGRKQLFSAASALEWVIKDDRCDEKLKEKALYQVANIMKEVNNEEAAEMYYEQLLETFPTSKFAPAAKRKLGFAA